MDFLALQVIDVIGLNISFNVLYRGRVIFIEDDVDGFYIRDARCRQLQISLACSKLSAGRKRIEADAVTASR